VLQDRVLGAGAALTRFRHYFDSCGVNLVDEQRPAADADVLSIQTYYHLFLSLYAVRIAELFTDRIDSSTLGRLVDGRGTLRDIINAQVFRNAGFENLLEPELYQ